MSEKWRFFSIACIPAYNEERTIATVVLRTMKHVDRVLVCDDGSSDMTSEIAERLGADVIRHDRNLGYGAALATLFRRAYELGVDVVVTLDADLQHNPEDIPRLLKPVLDGEADIVVGSRFMDERGSGVPRGRMLGIKLITRLANTASYMGLTDAQSGFRAYSRRALEHIKPTEHGMGASTELLLKAKEKGLRIKEIPIKVDYKVENPSTQNPIYHGLDVLLSTIKHLSIRHPLLFYGLPGTLALILAVIFYAWALQIYTSTRQLVTNITLIAIGATIIGLTLLTTAIILWTLVSLIREVK